MTINDNVSFGKIANTDINGHCITPMWSFSVRQDAILILQESSSFIRAPLKTNIIE
jgi:hypothetical protein